MALAFRRYMPIYDFDCRGCGNRFTEMMPIHEEGQRKVHCPECDSDDTEQRIEAPYVATAKKS